MSDATDALRYYFFNARRGGKTMVVHNMVYGDGCRPSDFLRPLNMTASITPRINGWEVGYGDEKFVFTEFKELTKFLRTRCKPIEEATDDE